MEQAFPEARFLSPQTRPWFRDWSKDAVLRRVEWHKHIATTERELNDDTPKILINSTALVTSGHSQGYPEFSEGNRI
jgi:hypothetical protein